MEKTENLKNSSGFTKPYFTASMIAKIAIFAALSFGLYMFPKFKFYFLELQFSDVPALIGGFILGPVAGIIIVTIKILLKLPFSETLYIGELGDLIIGIAFILPSSIIYKNRKTLKSAIIALLAGAFSSIAMAVISNIFILIPLYVKFCFEGSFEGIAGWLGSFVPSITAGNFYMPYILYIILPFNIIRCALACIITFLLYKRLSKLLKKF